MSDEQSNNWIWNQWSLPSSNISRLGGEIRQPFDQEPERARVPSIRAASNQFPPTDLDQRHASSPQMAPNLGMGPPDINVSNMVERPSIAPVSMALVRQNTGTTNSDASFFSNPATSLRPTYPSQRLLPLAPYANAGHFRIAGYNPAQPQQLLIYRPLGNYFVIPGTNSIVIPVLHYYPLYGIYYYVYCVFPYFM